MHLSNDALHRILSVPTVDTAAVVSYQLQDLWVSPAAMVTGGLTTLQASQLLNEGVFWRLEPILFCDQAAYDLGKGIEYPINFGGIKSAVSQYPSQYELTCRTGILQNRLFGNPILQKNAYTASTSAMGTIVTTEIGALSGSLPYVYKPLKVSKVAFTKLTEWPHGFSVKREIEYANEYTENVIPFGNSQFDSIGRVSTQGVGGLTTEDYKFVYDNVTIAPIGLDEGNGTIDEKFFTFAPKLEPSELNAAVFQTLTEPNAIGWNYTPLEAKTTPQPFPTNEIAQKVAELFPLDESPIAPLGTSDAAKLKTQQIYNLRSAEVQYLRDTATNYCSQFDWANQARGFDAVALRQRRLLDFNAIPIAPLELGKDYATLATSPDMGLQCYGDLPAIAWAPDPADESKVFALCRYRPPIRVPLPDWEWEDIGLIADIKNVARVDRDGFAPPSIFAMEEKKPFQWRFAKVNDPMSGTNFYPVRMSDIYQTFTEVTYDYSKKVFKFFSGTLQHYINGILDPTITQKNKDNDSVVFEISTSFFPSFSQKLCVELAPRVVAIGFSFAYLDESVKKPIVQPIHASAILRKKRNESSMIYEMEKFISAPDTKKPEVEAALDGFKAWAEEFFLYESSYTEIGRYRWVDENDKAMVDEPFYGHAAIFNSFNIDIRLTPAPA